MKRAEQHLQPLPLEPLPRVRAPAAHRKDRPVRLIKCKISRALRPNDADLRVREHSDTRLERDGVLFKTSLCYHARRQPLAPLRVRTPPHVPRNRASIDVNGDPALARRSVGVGDRLRGRVAHLALGAARAREARALP
eukprot:CAMPEP_0206219684 /NCGR_PEP_ID=MMETSP0047_2-20121206/4443_1 /ASSEMBLY_ACC=CAM_ASM_000192 /TAXON_ID=195065 /ORGANISM="Chroomonas mesostigmatica_cf, Strain CCMP1168" /LENGTH=137 /DNA_ID=CAMNT_0053642229 /DNA_START=599 /DNA_END=1008 /DNA_ORIENTATION=-